MTVEGSALLAGMREHGRGLGRVEHKIESLCVRRILKIQECAWYVRFLDFFDTT